MKHLTTEQLVWNGREITALIEIVVEHDDYYVPEMEYPELLDSTFAPYVITVKATYAGIEGVDTFGCVLPVLPVLSSDDSVQSIVQDNCMIQEAVLSLVHALEEVDAKING